MNLDNIKQLENLLVYMDYYVDRIAFRREVLYRVIDPTIRFPQVYDYVKYDGEMVIASVKSRYHPGKCWGTPDKEFHDVELYYLWKDMPVIPFDANVPFTRPRIH